MQLYQQEKRPRERSFVTSEGQFGHAQYRVSTLQTKSKWSEFQYTVEPYKLENHKWA